MRLNVPKNVSRKLSNHLLTNFGFVAQCLVAAGVLFSVQAHADSYADFFQAVASDDAAAVRSKLAQGFDPNAVDARGDTALFLALRDGSRKVAEVLIEAPGEDLSRVNAAGENALMMACLRGDLDLVRSMVAHGARVDKDGWTPLAYAASRGQTEVARFLIEHAARIDPPAPNGTTPLMLAAYYGYADTVKLLLDSGADPDARNAQGFDAEDLALKQGHQDIADRIAARMRADRPKGSW